VAAGWRVVSVVMTNGRWTPDKVSDEIIDFRNNESRAAAALLNTEPVFLGFEEGGFTESESSIRAMTAALRRSEAEVIVTHPPLDYHADHMAVSRCVLEACYRCVNGAYDCGEAPLARAPRLYYCDGWFTPFDPDLYVDVSEFIELKKKALACHGSQLGPGGPSPGDMIDLEATRARYRGIQAGVKHAEAFRFAPRAGSVRLAELLT